MKKQKLNERREKELVDSVKTRIRLENEKARVAKSATRSNRTKLLVSIVNQKDDIRLKEILDDVSVALSFTFAGTGTARSAVLDYLGIGETEKAVVGNRCQRTFVGGNGKNVRREKNHEKRRQKI